MLSGPDHDDTMLLEEEDASKKGGAGGEELLLSKNGCAKEKSRPTAVEAQAQVQKQIGHDDVAMLGEGENDLVIGKAATNYDGESSACRDRERGASGGCDDAPAEDALGKKGDQFDGTRNQNDGKSVQREEGKDEITATATTTNTAPINIAPADSTGRR